jgi:hypothetical protein
VALERRPVWPLHLQPIGGRPKAHLQPRALGP